jgi:D-alanyl-D-alanine carboxypeptidase-like protein
MSFYTEVIQPNPLFTSTKRIADLGLLEPDTRAAVEQIIRDAASKGIKLMVYETYRSQERQTELFNQGASKLRNVGVHHFGLACDLVKDVNGEPSWKGDFGFLKDLAEDNGLIWGGDWGNDTIIHNFVDADHVQRINVADQAKLFDLSWYPDEDYEPVVV